ncbi:hypothetical protein LSTR_LSTR015996 [Laodelphax striatellus]|uniref:Uncharacterized protein n=1 Tax=Laodelphax striatellus TaxID=195883 RepID=A0A482WJM2_LAOST|nr:hypothetical protein LSTR_LSTR015996 [Laodelphax striatellus]
MKVRRVVIDFRRSDGGAGRRRRQISTHASHPRKMAPGVNERRLRASNKGPRMTTSMWKTEDTERMVLQVIVTTM